MLKRLIIATAAAAAALLPAVAVVSGGYDGSPWSVAYYQGKAPH
jgi:hypothetical protein